MKRIITIIISLFCLAGSSSSQLTVTGSNGLDGTYSSFTNAGGFFNTLGNSVLSQAGFTINITITADITTETGFYVLANKNWTRIYVKPSGNRTISGSKAGNGLITYNNCSNIVFDGLNNGSNSLTISNTSNSNTAFTSTFLFIGASDCKITNCTVLGSYSNPVSASGTSTPVGGTILLGSGSAGSVNDTITYNNIGNSAGGTPSIAIGANSGVAFADALIKGNNIYNWFNTGGASAILLGINTTGTTIEDNRLYQTSAIANITTGNFLRFICINSTAGGGFTIRNNIMGYANSSGTGMLTYSGTGGRLSVMEITTGTTTVSSIQGNTINNINWTTGDAVTGFGSGNTISLLSFSGYGNIGTVTGNVLGETGSAASPTNGIYITSSSTTATGVSALYTAGTGDNMIQNNTIGSIAATGLAGSPFTFHGILVAMNASRTITGNSIGGTVANSISLGTTGTTTAATNVFGVFTSSAGSGSTITIGTGGAGNTIQNISANGSGTSTFYGVYNSGTPGTLNINNNSFSNNSSAGSGSFNHIFTQATPTASFNINNNSFLSATVSAATHSAVSSFISSSGGNATSCIASISNNAFSGFTYTGASGSSGAFYCIYNQANLSVLTIDNNSFNNLSLKISGSLYLCFNIGTTTTNVSFSNNYTTGTISKTLTGGNFTGYTPGVGAAAGTTVINNNNLSNMTATGTSNCYVFNPIANTISTFVITNNTINNISGGTAAYGIYLTGGAAGTEISGNTISGLSGNSGISAGITIGYGSAAITTDCFNNTVSGISTTGTGAYGIHVINLAIANIYKNKIYNLQASNTSGVTYGIYVQSASSGSTANIYNNLIADIKSPVTSSTSTAAAGIYLLQTGTTSDLNIYYNSIYLNASSSGTNFATSGLFHFASTVSTTGRLTLQNNIIVNNSVYNGVGSTVALRRSSGAANTLNNFSTASNNNLLYAGNPVGNNFIYSDGTFSLPTLSGYQRGVITAGTIHPRDLNSVTENPTFLSTSGASPNFLHINTSVATRIEKGGIPVSVADDVDGNSRDASFPDIGADEGAFTATDIVGPVISYTTVTSSVCTSPRTVSAVITDPSGVNTTAGTKPRIYFRKTTNTNGLGGTNTNTTDGWKYAEATNSSSPFSFTIDHSLLNGGLAGGDVIEYFVVAQDLLGNTTMHGSVPGVAPSSVALTASAFATLSNINSYSINAASSLAGTAGGVQVCNSYNVGGSASGIQYTDATCNLIVKVAPSGASPVAGTINACVKVEAATPFYNAEPYLVRHFDIEPVSYTASTTARITLYILQSEFDNYNSTNGLFPDLPTGSGDATGKGNLRVTQYHGVWGSQPLPGYYPPASGVLIDPVDADIVWNASNGWWEITFDITGFSGFFIHTTVTGFPLSSGSVVFNGKKQGAANILNWKTNTEQNIRGYEVQRSYDGQNFLAIGFVNSLAPGGNSNSVLQYNFTDNNFTGAKQYYRLKQISNDGRSSISAVVLITDDPVSTLVINNIFPNPANDMINVSLQLPAKDQVVISITDISGRMMIERMMTLDKGNSIITMATDALAKGTYLLTVSSSGDNRRVMQKFFKL